MSVYLQKTLDLEGPDPAVLEMKIHYLMSCLAKAGLLLDADGNATFAGEQVEEDAAVVRATIQGNQ